MSSDGFPAAGPAGQAPWALADTGPDVSDPHELLLDTRALLDGPGFRGTLRAGREERASRFPAAIPAQIPLTIAWGTRDRLLLNAQARRARLILPGARFLPLPGCGHVPMGDDPDLVARVLLEGSSSPLLGVDVASEAGS